MTSTQTQAHASDNATPREPGEASSADVPAYWFTPSRGVQVMLGVLLFLALIAAMVVAKAVLVPVMAALLLALLCKPIVRRLEGWGLWLPIAAAVVLGALGVVAVTIIVLLATPAVEWIDNAPQNLHIVEQRVRELRKPMQKITEASAEIDRITGDGEFVQKVEVAAEGFPMLDNSLAILGSTVVVVTLCYFLLVFWDDFLLNLVRSMPHLTAKKEAVAAVREAEHDVSHFLLVVTTINVGLGLVLWPIFWALGLPNPGLWAVAAGLLNFVPYLGAMTTFTLITLVSLIHFQSWGAVLTPPLVFLCATSIEGLLITPLALGRGLALNPVIVFLGLLFWGWVWGVMGALMAVPLLVFARVICAHFEPLHPISRLMGASRIEDTPATPPAPDPPPEPAPA